MPSIFPTVTMWHTALIHLFLFQYCVLVGLIFFAQLLCGVLAFIYKDWVSCNIKLKASQDEAYIKNVDTKFNADNTISGIAFIILCDLDREKEHN